MRRRPENVPLIRRWLTCTTLKLGESTGSGRSKPPKIHRFPVLLCRRFSFVQFRWTMLLIEGKLMRRVYPLPRIFLSYLSLKVAGALAGIRVHVVVRRLSRTYPRLAS